MSEIVVSGVGCVGSFGAGRSALERALAAGVPTTVAVERDSTRRPGAARRAALASDATIGSLVPAALARRMSQPSRLALAALRLALDEARLAEKDPSFAATAVVTATAFGPVKVTEQLLEAILLRGPEQASPAHFTESVASAPASQIALFCRALGPNLTLTDGTASPLAALRAAARLLDRGEAERAIVAAADEMTPLLFGILDRFRLLARPSAGQECARPFDRRRNGLLAGEGACALVLEREASARARGASPLVRIIASGAAFDPASPPTGWSHAPERLAAEFARELARRGIEPDSIDRVVAGAAGTRGGDRLEGLVLRRLFGERTPPPILAPKGTVGEFGGGFLAAAALAGAGFASYPTAGFAEPDPELGLVPHDGSPLPPARRILATSIAWGGAAAWALFEPA